MANPLSELKNLPTWGKVAIVAGGAGVVYLAFRQHENAANSAAASTASSSGTAADTVTDPSTGASYPATGIDPDSGLTYSEDISEFGSVEAADEQAEDGVNEDGLLGDESIGDIGGFGDNGVFGDSGEFEDFGTQTGTQFPNNASWSQAVESGLTDLGYSSTDVATALGYYFAGRSLGTAPDGTSYSQIIYAALAEYGTPPSGNFQVILAPTTGTATTGNNITVPNVVGRTDLDTAEGIITSAGLKAAAKGDSGVGNKGSVTSQSPAANTSVAAGSTVTLTYTVKAAATGSPAPTSTAKVKVPNVAGQEATQAETTLKSAGLTPKITLDANSDKPGIFHIITKTSPAAGSTVAKGTTIVLYYKDSKTA
jgi:hypothetical protein